MEDESIISFLKIIISELSEGINPNNYTEVLKLDDFNLINSYFDKMNSEEIYKIRRYEANLAILGMLSKDLINMKRKSKISDEECSDILTFLCKIISTKSLLAYVSFNHDWLRNIIEIGNFFICFFMLLSFLFNIYSKWKKIKFK